MFGQHPDAPIIRSQPGIGTILGARVLAEFGDDPHRYANARDRKNHSRMSPITRASGLKHVVLARYARDRRLAISQPSPRSPARQRAWSGPGRRRGFDHTVQGAYAVAAGVSRALGLNVDLAANAMAIAGTANNALRVTRTGALSHWKGLAYPRLAKEGTHAALLASVGITGPAEVFEGNKGFKQTIAGDFFIDWSAEDLERVRRTIVKKYNAEIHSQSTIDAALEIAATPGFDAAAIRAVRVTTFQVAFDIIGGGEEGDKHQVRTKEEADHSLPYMVAVALLDRQVLPAQYDGDRIVAADVQQLLIVVEIRPDAAYSKRFPDEMPTRVEVELADGTVLAADRAAYHGFHTDPLDWAAALAKFNALATPFAGQPLADQIASVISELDTRPVSALTDLLAQVPRDRHHEHAAATAAPAHP